MYHPPLQFSKQIHTVSLLPYYLESSQRCIRMFQMLSYLLTLMLKRKPKDEMCHETICIDEIHDYHSLQILVYLSTRRPCSR